MSQSFFDTIGLILGNTDAGRLKISETWCLPACWVCANIRPVRELLLLNRLKFLSWGHQYYHPLPGQLKRKRFFYYDLFFPPNNLHKYRTAECRLHTSKKAKSCWRQLYGSKKLAVSKHSAVRNSHPKMQMIGGDWFLGPGHTVFDVDVEHCGSPFPPWRGKNLDNLVRVKTFYCYYDF